MCRQKAPAGQGKAISEFDIISLKQYKKIRGRRFAALLKGKTA